ncbi:MAG: glycosyltransferase family 39 protein [Phycisphaerae bacterium]|nr:glycosyltransferase family 39 protein [Phycisphaerae bacterium]
MNTTPQPATSRFTRADLFLLIAAGLIMVGFRLHAYPAPLESDECNYAYFAGRMLQGDRLYVDLWDHQPPGIFAALMLATAVFGDAAAVYRTLALIAALLTMLGLFDVARRWFGRPAGWTAALLFAIASSDPGVGGEGCNREIYMNALVVAAFWLLACGETLKLRRVFLAGLLLGLASTIKTVVAVQWLALVPAVVLLSAPGSAENRGRHVKSIAAFAAGPVGVWLAMWLYFAIDGRSGEFLDATFAYNLVYSKTAQGWGSRLIAFFSHEKVFRTASALWLAGVLGLVALPWRRNWRRSLVLVVLVVGCFLAVCLPGKFWPHYYLLMMPPVVLLAAGLIHRVETYGRRLSFVVAGAIVVSLLLTEVPGYLLVSPERIALGRYGSRMSWVRDQAHRVAEVTDPQDSIYVYSADAGFYYYSSRRCATRFTMYTALISEGPSTAARRRLLLEDLAQDKPRLILLTAKPPFAELHQFFIDHRYVSVGLTGRMEVLCDIERRVAWPSVSDDRLP